MVKKVNESASILANEYAQKLLDLLKANGKTLKYESEMWYDEKLVETISIELETVSEVLDFFESSAEKIREEFNWWAQRFGAPAL